MEVDRPNRQARHRNGKADDLDAIEAARAVVGPTTVAAKTRAGNAEALRVLSVRNGRRDGADPGDRQVAAI